MHAGATLYIDINTSFASKHAHNADVSLVSSILVHGRAILTLTVTTS